MTTTTNQAQSEAPFGFLMTLIIALLAPMFLGITAGNIDLARMAAIETVNDYRAENRVSLIAVAQIIAFGLAAVGSLSLSMEDGISAPMAMRLRSNANACERSAEQNRRALHSATAGQCAESSPAASEAASEAADFYDTIFRESETQPEPEVFLTPQAEQLLAAESAARLQPNNAQSPNNQQAWAAAMVREADEIDSNIANLPPDQRPAASMQAATLRDTASSLLRAQAPTQTRSSRTR